MISSQDIHVHSSALLLTLFAGQCHAAWLQARAGDWFYENPNLRAGWVEASGYRGESYWIKYYSNGSIAQTVDDKPKEGTSIKVVHVTGLGTDASLSVALDETVLVDGVSPFEGYSYSGVPEPLQGAKLFAGSRSLLAPGSFRIHGAQAPATVFIIVNATTGVPGGLLDGTDWEELGQEAAEDSDVCPSSVTPFPNFTWHGGLDVTRKGKLRVWARSIDVNESILFHHDGQFAGSIAVLPLNWTTADERGALYGDCRYVAPGQNVYLMPGRCIVGVTGMPDFGKTCARLCGASPDCVAFSQADTNASGTMQDCSIYFASMKAPPCFRTRYSCETGNVSKVPNAAQGSNYGVGSACWVKRRLVSGG